MTNFETPPPLNEPEYPFTFKPVATLRLTEFGRKVLEASDQSRIERLAAKIGKYPDAVAEHLASRIGPDNTVSMTPWEFHDTLAPFVGPDMPQVVEREIIPKPIVVTEQAYVPPGGPEIFDDAPPESPHEISDNIRPNQTAGPTDSTKPTGESSPARRFWGRR